MRYQKSAVDILRDFVAAHPTVEARESEGVLAWLKQRW